MPDNLTTVSFPYKIIKFSKSFLKQLSFKNTFSALTHRNFKLWFYGQTISLIGTWMQITAQSFLIFELTHSSSYLGYVGFASGIPSWFFMFYGGVVVDRVSRRTVLIITQVALMVLSIILAYLTFSGNIEPWHILVLSLLTGVAVAFDAPARQTFINELVHREHLTNAIALNATMFNTASAVGPAFSGVAYALVGPAWCFTINAVSFIAVIIGLFMIKLDVKKAVKKTTSVISDLKEGLSYIKSHKLIRTFIFFSAAVSLLGVSFTTLIPAWAVKILGGDSTTNGMLQSARGVGALLSALVVASLGAFNFRGKLYTLGAISLPIFIIFFAIFHFTFAAYVTLFIVGASTVLVYNLTNAFLQSLVTDELRGRVLAVYTFTFFGLMPLGSLLIGNTAEWIGETFGIILFALLLLACAMYIYLRVPKIRAL
ncbi:MAG: MFS transporter [Bacteroidetes bacterium]|nr:MFS transporter [Bacteroidota bacterium]